MAVLQESTVEHLETRKKFGQAIGDFQVLQHCAVDMFIAYEQARSMVYIAALNLSGADASARATAAAKEKIG